MRGARTVLDRVTLSVSLGEHVAILGPNGSGKSSLIKTIARELHPLESGPGSWLKILGKDRWNIFHLRPQLGVVSPDWVEMCTRPISGREAVLSGFFCSTEIWPHNQVTPAMEQRADQLMEQLEIGHLSGHLMSEMSSGESRRVVIARALVHDPKALILDEPASSLDPRAVAALRDMLRRIAQSGVSIILVTHHLPEIIPEIQRVILMKDGKVYRDGAKDVILSSESLSELFDMPVELIERDGCFHLVQGLAPRISSALAG